jgi:hypothetical protein
MRRPLQRSEELAAAGYNTPLLLAIISFKLSLPNFGDEVGASFQPQPLYYILLVNIFSSGSTIKYEYNAFVNINLILIGNF